MSNIKLNRLTVDEPIENNDNSVVYLHENRLEELNIQAGDIIKILGKRRKDTICIAMINNNFEENTILVNK